MSPTDQRVTATERSSQARPASDTGQRRLERSDQTVLIGHLRNRATLVDASTGKPRWQIKTDQDIREMVHGGETVYLACGAARGEGGPRPDILRTPEQTPARGEEPHVAGERPARPVEVELDRVIPDPARPHGFLFRTSSRAGIVIELRFVAAQVEARRARDGALLWRFGGPALIGTAQMRLHEGTLAVLSPFGNPQTNDTSLYGLDAGSGSPRWIRDYRAEGLRLRTPSRSERSGESTPDAAGMTDMAGMTARMEPWHAGEWRLQHQQTPQPPEPDAPTQVERLSRGWVRLVGAGGGLLFLHARLSGQSGDAHWALERVEAVDAVTGDTRWSVTAPQGCEVAVSPAGRIVAIWRRYVTPLMINDPTRVMLLDGASGQLLTRFRLGANRAEEERLRAAPLDVAPTRTTELFLGVTDDGVAYLARASHTPGRRGEARALSAAPIADHEATTAGLRSASVSSQGATRMAGMGAPTPLDMPDWDALDWDATPAPKPLWTTHDVSLLSKPGLGDSESTSWVALGPEVILTILDTPRAPSGQSAYIALRGLDPATGAERWTWRSPKSLAELIGVWRGRAPGAFGRSIQRDLRPRWGNAIGHAREQHSVWREQDHLPREPRGALGRVVDRVRFWGEVAGVYREHLLGLWRGGQWRAPATLFEYAVTRDDERVYVASRLGLFALGARDGRLRWFAVPNEECAAIASPGQA